MVGIDRKTYHYQSKLNADNEVIQSLLRELSSQHPQYGFKSLLGLLKLQGYRWNHKRVKRIYCELKLNLKRKPKKRLAPRTAEKLTIPEVANDTWSIDFMHDALTYGRRFRTMNIIDDYRRQCLGIKIGFSITSRMATQYLDEVALKHGYPKIIRLDNGVEHRAKHFIKWAKTRGIYLKFIQPGKPAQNAYIERFNRTYREAVLDMFLFDSLREAKQLTQEWIRHYNYERPHQALGMKPPIIGEQQNSLLKVR